MQLDEYGAAARGVQFVDYPRNERERTRMLNERSAARENVIKFAASEKAARGIITILGLDNDDDLLNAPVAEPVPGDASPAGFSPHFLNEWTESYNFKDDDPRLRQVAAFERRAA